MPKFFTSGEPHDDLSHSRVVDLLLQAIHVHTVEITPEDNEAFRSDVSRLIAQIHQQTPVADLMIVTGKVIRTFEQYNLHVKAQFKSRMQEMRGIATALLEAMQRNCRASQASVSRLKEIESQLRDCSETGELHAIKARLVDCLRQMVMEAENTHQESARELRRIPVHQTAEPADEEKLPRGDLDPVTGLPDRSECVLALRGSRSHDAHTAAVVFAVSQMQWIVSRYGVTVGDDFLRWIATYLCSGTNAEIGFFRWDEQSFVCLIDREVTTETLQGEVVRLIHAMPQFEFTVDGRTSILPPALKWKILREIARPALPYEIDAYVASQMRTESPHGEKSRAS